MTEEFREQLKAEHRCTECGKPLRPEDGSRVWCAKCRRARREQYRATHEQKYRRYVE